MCQYPPRQSSQQGIVLIEALIAILIFSFAVLGIIGLQAAMVKNTSDAKYRVDASNIAQKAIGEMWTHPDNMAPAGIAAYLTQLQATVPTAQLPSGALSITAAPTPGQYIVSVTWTQPGQGEVQHNYTTIATISGG